MKILCEVSLNVSQFQKSRFHWLKGEENYLFTFEDAKRLRMINIRQDNGCAKEAQSASLAESRYCSCISWNRDESLLALVVDRRLIYFWDVRRNQFSQFKPSSGESSTSMSYQNGGRASNSGASLANRKVARNKDIELIAWSKISDRLVICYENGHILLCQIAIGGKSSNATRDADNQGQENYTSTWERLLDRREGVLQRVASIVVSDSADVFACCSCTSELLIVSFDGQTKFYCQDDKINLFNAKFSPLIRENNRRSNQYIGQSLYLALQSENQSSLHLKKIALGIEQALDDEPLKLFVPQGAPSIDQLDNHSSETCIINFHWLDSAHLMLCLETGSIKLVRIPTDPTRQNDKSSIKFTELLKIDATRSLYDSGLTTPVSSASSRPADQNLGGNRESSIETKSVTSESSSKSHSANVPTSSSPVEDRFKMFELVRVSNKNSAFRQTFALAAVTNYKLFYFELHELKDLKFQNQINERFSFEHFDDIDLSDSLQRVNLKLERVEWSQDCSLISLQVTSGHLLIYKTQVQNPMVVSHGSRRAFLSSADEVTILDYGSSLAPYESSSLNQPYDRVSSPSETASQASGHSRYSPASTRAGDKAMILSVHLKPSLIAIGPRHLALALNNRVRFYPLEGSQASTSLRDADTTGDSFHELEYRTIVTGIGLSSHFVVVQFDDYRLKLHGIKGQDYAESIDNERFFPDPSQPEPITAFTLTENLLVFCTESRIDIFSLSGWIIVQSCDLSGVLTARQIKRLRPNERGNQFACLVGTESSNLLKLENVALYDLYSNEIVSLMPGQGITLWSSLVERQIISTINMLTFDRSLARKVVEKNKLPINELDGLGDSNIVDAIWDTDGRSLLLVGPRFYHVFAILCHTLSQRGPTCVYATSARKPVNYVTLYISQGVVSYQTGLGRVINSILETHDEELKLNQLEARIQEIKDSLVSWDLSNKLDDGNESGSEPEALTNADGVAGNGQMGPNSTKVTLMGAHLRITLLKVNYLCTILPIYPLTKCRDICKHIMNEEAFNMNPDFSLIHELANEYKLINQMVFKLLAAWSLFILNLGFASQTYDRNGLQIQAELIKGLLDDIKTRRMDSRFWVNRRILSILGMESSTID